MTHSSEATNMTTNKLTLIPKVTSFKNFPIHVYDALPVGAVFACFEDEPANGLTWHKYVYDPNFELACDCWYVKASSRSRNPWLRQERSLY